MNMDLMYWLAFDRLTGIGLGHKRTQTLLNHFSSAKEAWEASKEELSLVANLPESVVDSFIATRSKVSLEEGLSNLDKTGSKAFTQQDAEYPQQLMRLSQPPLIIYVKGKWNLDYFHKAIGIVGTREASEYALNLTKEISMQLASTGFTIISGMALGVDSAAHAGAFQVPNSEAVAVLANGVDKIVPLSSRPIYELLAKGGSIISEYPPGTLPEKGYFPARNRIIAALSQAVLVAEAGVKSGSLITAEKAVELGKTVFGLAARVDNKNSEGIHRWIRKGKAILVTSAEDILEELNMPEQISFVSDKAPIMVKAKQAKKEDNKTEKIVIKKRELPPLSSTEEGVYGLLPETDFLSVDVLIEKAGLPIAKVNSAIMTLQLKKLIQRDASGAIGKV
jgi:DNA processing protein